jgi:hypothetical protein
MNITESSVWTEIQESRAKAHAKHGENSIEAIRANDPRWLSILVEEVGEVAHELTYDAAPTEQSYNPHERHKRQAVRVRRELLDVLSVASAWLDATDRLIDGLPHPACNCPPDQHAYGGCLDHESRMF